MMRLAALLAICAAASPFTPARAAADPRHPDQALAGLDAHPEVDVTLWAAEPLLLSPSAIDIDARGRVWVCEVVNYRRHQGKRPEGDRILILEDRDGDGRADRQTVFHQAPDLLSPHGITVLGNRVLVVAGEQAFYLIDDDGDDRADRKELLFTRVGGVQHDHNLHAFHFGPDGKLYFNFGNAGQRLCDKEGQPLRDRAGNPIAAHGKPYRQGMIFRCDLDGTNVETLAWNFRNNWEVAVDAFGGLWQSDNDDDGNRGVRLNYVLEFGNYGYVDERTGAGWQADRANRETDIPSRHWHLNDPGVVPNLILTGGGSPTGLVVYEGRTLPAAFQGQPLHCDAGPNVVRAYPTRASGAGYTAEMLPLLEGRRDKWFRPSDVAVAPDGAVIVADWYDPGVGGHGMGDLDRGRLYRVQGKGAGGAPALDLDSTAGAIRALLSPNMAQRYLGWQALTRRPDAAAALRALARDPAADPRERARALGWLGAQVGPRDVLEIGLSASEPDLRLTAIRSLFTAWREGRVEEAALVDAFRRAAEGAHPRVRAAAAVHLRFAHSPAADALWADLARASDPADRWMTEALGIGADLVWDARLAALGSDVERLPEVIWRSRGTGSAARIAEQLARAEAPARWVRAFHFQPEGEAKEAALRQAFRQAPAPAAVLLALYALDPAQVRADAALRARLESLIATLPRDTQLIKLAARFGVEGLEDTVHAFIAAQPDDPLAAEVVKGLLGRPDDLRARLRPGDASARALARAIGKANDRRGHDLLRDALGESTLSPAARQHVVDALAQSKGGADRLVELKRTGALPGGLEFAVGLAFSRSPHGHVRDLGAREFPLPAAVGADKLPAPAELLKLKGDAARGAAAYTKATCATCHVVQGAGLALGPDLSQIGGKLPPEAMLEAILHPSSAIAHGYQGVAVTLRDGNSAAGIPTSDDGRTLTLALPGGGRQNVPVADIVKRENLAESLMPPGLAAALSAQELADLLAWLGSLK
jgi:putative membrane-bound dehydrogenase-like protein